MTTDRSDAGRPARSITLGRAVLIGLACLQLAACASYGGPVTNKPDQADVDGPPLLSGYYAP